MNPPGGRGETAGEGIGAPEVAADLPEDIRALIKLNSRLLRAEGVRELIIRWKDLDKDQGAKYLDEIKAHLRTLRLLEVAKAEIRRREGMWADEYTKLFEHHMEIYNELIETNRQRLKMEEQIGAAISKKLQ